MTEDFNNRWHFNTSIAALMELINTLYEEEDKLSRAALDQILPALVLLLGPFAPYMAEELWEQLGRTGPVFRQTVAGLRRRAGQRGRGRSGAAGERQGARAHSSCRSEPRKEELERLALADPKTQPFIAGKQVVKVIVVPDKLVNIVVR